jgi:hypothetical protein
MTTPDPKRRDIAAESAANAASLQKFVKDFQANQVKSLAPAAAVLATATVFAAKRQAEAQNAAMLEGQFQIRKQLWIQNKLLAGWTMAEIDEEIAAGEALVAAQAQADAEANQTDLASVGRFLVCVVLSIGLSVLCTGMSFWPSTLIWVGIPIGLLVWWNSFLRRGRESRQGSAATADAGSMTPNIGSGEHSQWVDDFRTEQASKQKDDPPTD